MIPRMNLHALEAVGNVPPLAVGIVFLVLLVVALLAVRNAGKGRPHA